MIDLFIVDIFGYFYQNRYVSLSSNNECVRNVKKNINKQQIFSRVEYYLCMLRLCRRYIICKPVNKIFGNCNFKKKKKNRYLQYIFCFIFFTFFKSKNKKYLKKSLRTISAKQTSFRFSRSWISTLQYSILIFLNRLLAFINLSLFCSSCLSPPRGSNLWHTISYWSRTLLYVTEPTLKFLVFHDSSHLIWFSE